MPKRAKELSAIQVKRLAKVDGFHAVGGVPGLHLQVSGDSISWIHRYKLGDRRRDMGLGSYPSTTLVQAREKASSNRDLISEGLDPIDEKQALRRARIAEQVAHITFEQAAKECHSANKAKFKNEKYAKQWLASLERHAIPVIGKLSVMELETEHIHRVLEPIWTSKPTVAGDVRRRMEKVISYTYVKKDVRGRANPARWEGNLKELLISTAEARRAKNSGTEKHHPALPYKQIAAFLADLRGRKGIGCRALEFTIVTAARSGEVRGATWGEIDWEAREGVIPASRMKARRAHIVPLSNHALAILKALPRGEPEDLIFPAQRGGTLSDTALTMQIRRMHSAQVEQGKPGYTDPKQHSRTVTPHGFRSTFRDWFAEETDYPNEMGELALAHVVADKTEAAYRRGTMKKKRVQMMQDWADYCAPNKNVVKMRGKA